MHLGIHLGLENHIADVMYVGAMVALLLSIFWRPQTGLYFLIPLIPLQTIRYRLHGYFLGEKLVDIILLGVLLGVLLREGPRGLCKTSLNRFLILLCLFYYVSLWRGAFYLGSDLPISIDDERFSFWKNFAVLPILTVAVAAAIKNIKQMKILILLMGVSVLLLNYGFHNTIQDRDLSHFSYGLRYSGAIGYAGENGLAAFEAGMAVFLLGLYCFEKQFYRKLALLSVIATCIYSLLYTYSRGGYISFLAGLLFLGIFKDRRLLVLLMIFAFVWTAIVPTSVQERINMTYSGGELDSSAEERLTLWQDAMTIFNANSIIGTGFYTYAFMDRVGQFRDTHNLYIKVLLETGIVGIVLLLVLFGKTFSQGWALFRHARDPFFTSLGLGFAALIICTVIGNLFGDRWFYLQVTGYLWALLGCILRARTIEEELSDNPSEEVHHELEFEPSRKMSWI